MVDKLKIYIFRFYVIFFLENFHMVNMHDIKCHLNHFLNVPLKFTDK